MYKAGNVFVGPYPPGSGKKRRFIVVTDERRGEDTVVWVYASTSTDDHSVLLLKGVHPEVTADCYIVYEEAEIVATADIAFAVSEGALVQAAPLQPSTLKAVQGGIYFAEETPLEVMDYCDGRF